MEQKKNRLEKCSYHHSEWNLTVPNFLLAALLKMAWISTSVLFYAYRTLYILTELSANDVKFTSVDRQKLDLSIYIYLWYRKFYICRDTARFYEHKNDPRMYGCSKEPSRGDGSFEYLKCMFGLRNMKKKTFLSAHTYLEV